MRMFRILTLSSAREFAPTVLPYGVTESTARAVRDDLNRNASIRGLILYRLQESDTADLESRWFTVGPPDPMRLPDDGPTHKCPNYSVGIPARCRVCGNDNSRVPV